MWIEYEVDDSWDEDILYQRIKDVYNKHNSLWIAYDLDDTVRPYRSSSCEDTIRIIKRCRDVLNAHFIVYTANPDKKANIKFLEDNDLPYEAINCYPDSFKISPFEYQYKNAVYFKQDIPKLYYNILLDDKSCGLERACEILDKLCDEVEMIKNDEKLKQLNNF